MSKQDKWKPDAYSQLDTWIHRWEPLSKSLAALGFILGVVSFNSINLLVTALILVLVVAITSRLPFSFLIKRLTWILPFILLMLVTLSLSGGLPISLERVSFASLISLKAFTSVLTMILLMGTQPLQEYLHGLSRMGLPHVLITILFLAYRYVFLFRNELQSTQRSLAARNFKPDMRKGSIKTYGEVAGGMMLRAIDRSETVYQAMAARGFDGRLRTHSSRSVLGWDVFKALMVAFITIALIIIERRILI